MSPSLFLGCNIRILPVSQDDIWTQDEENHGRVENWDKSWSIDFWGVVFRKSSCRLCLSLHGIRNPS